MNRRDFLTHSLAASIGARLASTVQAAAGRAPRIVLRSSWQVVNIGDIAHTPGVLALLEKYLPDAEVVLWASGDLTDEVAQMEHHRFPRLRIVKGSISKEGRASHAELGEVLERTDFLLHGSGPSLVAQRDVAAFVEHFHKPFGVYGITYGGGSASQVELLTRARFAFFRDTVSLAKAKSDGVACPIMEFGPDGAFACDLRDDAGAEAFLAENDLRAGEFVCCIPRLRYTPYWLIKKGREKDETRATRNQEMAEHDHRPLREAIAAIARETDLRILVCPEDMTQMAVGKQWLVDPLPEEVRRRVVWRDSFWLTDLALSTYIRSAGLFGLEMHSPIMCIGNGIPAIVCRFEEQTSKGFMWRDVGLGDWLFDADDADRMAEFVPTVLRMVTDRQDAAAHVAKAQAVVTRRQRETMQTLQSVLPPV